MNKQLLFILVVIASIIIIIIYSRYHESKKEEQSEEKHVHFKEPIEDTGPISTPVHPIEKTEKATPKKSSENEEFVVPHFNVCSGAIKRNKDDVKTPKFDSFGFSKSSLGGSMSRGMAIGDGDLSAESFESGLGAFRKEGIPKLVKTEPRFTLAMKMMKPDDIKMLINNDKKETSAAANTVLNKIDKVKEDMEKH